ncbi:hypothetical protein LBMAG56_51960 [Verrucomicrobiota bacterium]|nr:hypothetical protein LBMAG56_51960 [Verrucomicrobiota bacterium]
MLTPRIVFGYHGCDESTLRMVLDGGTLRPSQNAYDWLGHGVYFWESSSARALRWAAEVKLRPKGTIQRPAVLGAIIDLGHCLDLIDPDRAQLVQDAYVEYLRQCKEFGVPPAKNKGPESKARFLDCAVMNLLHKLSSEEGMPPFDTVRGFFVEGQPLYPTAGLRSLDHVQICVRSPECIAGFFRPNAMR